MALTRTGTSRRAVNAIMGIGFRTGESANYHQYTRKPFTYPTILDNMVKQGLIKSRSYSVWLDNMWNNTGVILFGGFDTEKYVGELVTLPIQKNPNNGQRDAMYVEWTGLTVNRGDEKHITSKYNVSPASPQPAVLDTGTTVTVLPDDIADAIYAYIGADVANYGMPTVPCNIPRDYTFTFSFGSKSGAHVSVSIFELLVPSTSDKDTCMFMIHKAGKGPTILGDSFLRSAYVVFDLDNYQIGIAQTNFEATATADGDKITPIVSGIPSVPADSNIPGRPAHGSAGPTIRASLLSMVIVTVMTLLWLVV